MVSRRSLMASALALGVLAVAPAASALERLDYTIAAFDAALAAGKPILVEIQAPWCPTCRAQTPILSKIEERPEFANLVVLHIDFDSQKDAVRRFRALKQSTLIAFKGGKEAARSLGDTDPASLAALVAKTL